MTILNIAKLKILQVPMFLSNLLKLDKPTHRDRLYVPKFCRNHFQNNFCYQAPHLWNLLTSSVLCNNITNSPTLTSMKSRLKRFLLKIQIYANETEWTDANNSISTFLTEIRIDPYADNIINY